MTSQAQESNWNLFGNSIDSNNFLGSINHEDFKLISDSVIRIILSKDGEIKIFGNVNLENNNIVGDTGHFHVIHVGDSSLYLGTTPYSPTEQIYTSTGDLNIQCNLSYNLNTILNASGNNAFVGIGTTSPQAKLHVTAPAATRGIQVDVNSSYEIIGSGTSDNMNIFSESDMYLLTDAGKRMYFGTNNINSRMLMDVSGNVGIGVATPLDRVHIGGGDLRVGEINVAGPTAPSYGRKIWFSGANAMGGQWDSDNSDPLWMARYNYGSDKSLLFLNNFNSVA